MLGPPSVLLRFRFSGYRWRSFIPSERRVTILLAKFESTERPVLMSEIEPASAGSIILGARSDAIRNV